MSRENEIAIAFSKIVAIARQVLDGKIDPIEGPLEIIDLCKEIGIQAEQIYNWFIPIVTQVDDLPRGDALRLATDEFRERSTRKKAEYMEFFRDVVKDRCRKVIHQFGGVKQDPH